MTQSILYLVRGLPGSGKSTFVRSVIKQTENHAEADMYFHRAGQYQFDATKLHAAHTWCQNEARASLMNGVTTWVSNTFTTMKELQPYFEIARDTKSKLIVMTMNGDFESIHGVPEEKMKQMRDRFQHDISPLYTILG